MSGGATPLDILHDRQTWYSPDGGEADKQALHTLLNRCGLMKSIQARMAAYVRQRHVNTSEPKEVVLYENDFVKAVGNSNGSHGYFYLTVFIKPPPDLTKLVFENDPDAARAIGGSVWSNEHLPRVGDRIRLNNRMADQVCGKEVTVLAHAVEVASGPFLFLITTHPDPTFNPGYEQEKARQLGLLSGSVVPDRWTNESDIKLYNEPGYMLKRPGLDVLYIMGRDWEPVEADGDVLVPVENHSSREERIIELAGELHHYIFTEPHEWEQDMEATLKFVRLAVQSWSDHHLADDDSLSLLKDAYEEVEQGRHDQRVHDLQEYNDHARNDDELGGM